MDIYNEKFLHPGEDNPVKEHYKDFYDTVFIAFSPFFKIKDNAVINPDFQKSHIISFDEAKEAIPILKKNPQLNASIYSYHNNNYPTEKQILENGISVSWDDIRQSCDFKSYSDIYKALRTSIGGYKQVFMRADLSNRLLDFTKSNQIFIPTEGHFETLSKIKLLKAFQLLDKKTIVVEDEFYEKKTEIDITNISNEKFVEAIAFKDYYIYDTDKQLLFAVGWDDFFFLICSNKDSLKKINDNLNFEGFYCNDNTELGWELTKEEWKEGLDKENKQKQNIFPTKNPWWKVW